MSAPDALAGTATLDHEKPGADLRPLFETILSHIPAPHGDETAPTAMLVGNLDYDDYVGRLAIGRVVAGSLEAGQTYALCRLDGSRIPCKISRLYTWQGLKRVEADSARAGDIAVVAGIAGLGRGETLPGLGNSRPPPPVLQRRGRAALLPQLAVLQLVVVRPTLPPHREPLPLVTQLVASIRELPPGDEPLGGKRCLAIEQPLRLANGFIGVCGLDTDLYPVQVRQFVLDHVAHRHHLPSVSSAHRRKRRCRA